MLFVPKNYFFAIRFFGWWTGLFHWRQVYRTRAIEPVRTLYIHWKILIIGPDQLSIYSGQVGARIATHFNLCWTGTAFRACFFTKLHTSILCIVSFYTIETIHDWIFHHTSFKPCPMVPRKCYRWACMSTFQYFFIGRLDKRWITEKAVFCMFYDILIQQNLKHVVFTSLSCF